MKRRVRCDDAGIVVVAVLLLGATLLVALRLATSVYAAGISQPQSPYVPATQCASCHKEIALSFGDTAMAHSFYPISRDPIAQAIVKDVVYHHEPSHTWFAMSRHDGVVYQSRWRTDDAGSRIDMTSEEVDDVIGSGNHVRTYLHRNADGTLTELPLAWYAEGGGTWALNPGFDNPTPSTHRLLAYDCMFCHNGYPQIPVGEGDTIAHPAFTGDLPSGIDCQRCHGPGRAHVEAASTPAASLNIVRSSIFNPDTLSGDRQMEVCMQCHLEITSRHLPDRITRYDHAPFTYTPDKPLASFFEFFEPDPRKDKGSRFEIASSAYRLRQSQCYLQSQGALTCTTCHDPHRPHDTAEQQQAYRNACLLCHSKTIATLVAANQHPAQQDCIGCHMPRRRTADVVHAVMTDHLIQKPVSNASSLVALLTEVEDARTNRYDGPVLPYKIGSFSNRDDDLYLAVAQVLEDSNPGSVDNLAHLLEVQHPSRAEFYLILGDAYHRYHRTADAMSAYRRAIALHPQSVRAQRSLGAALAEDGQLDAGDQVLADALRAAPLEPLIWYERGRLHIQQRKYAQAADELTRACSLDPHSPEGFNELGIAKANLGDFPGAEQAFRQSLRVYPYDGNVQKNLELMGRQLK